MTTPYWHKQSDQPLFKDLIWDKPDNKLYAGKLLIIGGNKFNFSIPAKAFQYTKNAGIGVCKVLLPDSLQKSIGKHFEDGEFAPSNPSGGFSIKALPTWLDYAKWADGVLLTGDFGNNSETTILIERFIETYSGNLIINDSSLTGLGSNIQFLLNRAKTTLVLSFKNFQKFNSKLNKTKPITSKMPLLDFVTQLHEISQDYKFTLVVNFENTIFVAHNGEVSSSELKTLDFTEISSYIAVWQIQNPDKILPALTTALYELK